MSLAQRRPRGSQTRLATRPGVLAADHNGDVYAAQLALIRFGPSRDRPRICGRQLFNDGALRRAQSVARWSRRGAKRMAALAQQQHGGDRHGDDVSHGEPRHRGAAVSVERRQPRTDDHVGRVQHELEHRRGAGWRLHGHRRRLRRQRQFDDVGGGRGHRGKHGRADFIISHIWHHADVGGRLMDDESAIVVERGLRRHSVHEQHAARRQSHDAARRDGRRVVPGNDLSFPRRLVERRRPARGVERFHVHDGVGHHACRAVERWSDLPGWVHRRRDPFVALGGGTCANGGWLPPGAALFIAGAASAPTPQIGGCIHARSVHRDRRRHVRQRRVAAAERRDTAAQSPAPPSAGCTTPDPFVVLGGGTCFNGDWLPPGMSPATGNVTPVAPPVVPPRCRATCRMRDLRSVRRAAAAARASTAPGSPLACCRHRETLRPSRRLRFRAIPPDARPPIRSSGFRDSTAFASTAAGIPVRSGD